MATTTVTYRGNDITWTSVFKDSTGATVVPASANLYLTFKTAGVVVKVTTAMTIGATTATALWNSSPADADYVDWCVKTGASPLVVDQGIILLKKNRSNPGT